MSLLAPQATEVNQHAHLAISLTYDVLIQITANKITCFPPENCTKSQLLSRNTFHGQTV